MGEPVKPELVALQWACTQVARVLNHYLPAIPEKRTEVSCIGVAVTEGPHKGKLAAWTFLKHQTSDGEGLEFATSPIFETTDTLDHIVHVTVGSFLTEWFAYVQNQDPTVGEHPEWP